MWIRKYNIFLVQLRSDPEKAKHLYKGLVGSVFFIALFSVLFTTDNTRFISKSGKVFAYYREFDGQISDDVFEINYSTEIEKIHLVVVVCGGTLKPAYDEALTMIKSAVLFTKLPLNVHIFTLDMEEQFKEEFGKWPKEMVKNLEITYHEASYPLDLEDVANLKEWWAPCASLRLFLPEIMKEVDSIIYVDCDIVFLSPVDDLWNHFKLFDKNDVGALAPRVGWEFNVPSTNEHFITKEDGTKTQVNSGVFLMNLTRMRENVFSTSPKISNRKTAWTKELTLPLYNEFKSTMYGDQDLINIIFHFNKDLIYYLPCRFNYHHKFCFDKHEQRWCKSAEKEGAALIHGTAKTFHNNYAPAFKAAYTAMQEYWFQSDMHLHLLTPMIKNLNADNVLNHQHCGNKTEIFIKELKRHLLT